MISAMGISIAVCNVLYKKCGIPTPIIKDSISTWVETLSLDDKNAIRCMINDAGFNFFVYGLHGFLSRLPQSVPPPQFSYAVHVAAVKYTGWAIQCINNPDENLKIIAVMNEGMAIRHIPNPSYEVQLAAVTQNGLALEYANNNPQLDDIAVRNNAMAIRFVVNQTLELQLLAVTEFGISIRHIYCPPKTVQLAAVMHTIHAIDNIHDPCIEAILASGKSPTRS